MYFYLIIVLTAIIDQVSKLWIRAHLQVGDSMPFWEPYITFSHYQNTGAAGSSFQGYGRYFIIVGVLFVAGALYYRLKGKLKGIMLESGAAFLVGGAIGNTIDRIWFGKVTDFLVFGSRNGVLNIADLCLNAGVLLILADMLLNMWRARSDKRRSSDSTDAFMHP